jgi:hypothetical protein
VDQIQWYVKSGLLSTLIAILSLGGAYGLYLLDIGQTVLVTENAWAGLCAGWGVSSDLFYNNWGFSMNPLVCGLSK